MARPYSLDLRERVVAAVESGRTVRDVASSFGVSFERREVRSAIGPQCHGWPSAVCPGGARHRSNYLALP